MQDDTPQETEAAAPQVDPATPYQPPTILWREKFPVRSVIGASNIQGQVDCGGSSSEGGYEGG